MNLSTYFFHTALHNLRRGGQRVFVALLCIAFGVMSVVSMTLLSDAIESMMVTAPEELIGADITMDRVAEDAIYPEHTALLESLRREGKIEQFTTVAYLSSLAFRLPGTGEMLFIGAGMGIDPAVYPLKGSFQLSSPSSAGIETLLQQPGDLLVTRDIAQEEGLHPGDQIILSNFATGSVVPGTVQGIIGDTPNHQGSKIYYSYETAALLAGSIGPQDGGLQDSGPQDGGGQNTALLTSDQPEALIPLFTAQGWRAFTAEKLIASEQQVQDIFEISLKGAGLLGMLVGGIGIANTMQVLLRRRRREVAALKTIGYRQSHLQWMFTIEAALLGTAGSLIGAALGVVVSIGLVNLFSRTTNLLIHWSITPAPVLNGVLVGLVTAVCFAMFSILHASQVSPLALLRSEAVDATRIPRLQGLLVLLLCGGPFFAAAAVIMGSALRGAGVLLFALAGFAGLGGLLRGLAWLTTRLLPVRRWPLAHMARNNLRRRGGALVFAMIALFTGVVSLALGVVVTSSAQRAMDERLVEFNGSNITVIAPADQEQAIHQAIEKQSAIEQVFFGYQTPVRSIVPDRAEGKPIPPLLIGRTEPEGFDLQGAEWGSQPDGVYASAMRDIPAGSEVVVILQDGSQTVLPVVGSYQFNGSGTAFQIYDGLLMQSALSQRLARPATVQFYLRAGSGQVKTASGSLGKSLPQAIVINLVAHAARFTQAYKNLFLFALSMASLALLAGVLLLANSVSLAMLDRRYEIGVMRAMGYAHRQVLFTLVVEYSLVALIATAAGLLVVRGLLWGIGLANRLAGSLLVLTPRAALFIGTISVGLPLLTVLWVTWRPANVSPVVVLNDRE